MLFTYIGSGTLMYPAYRDAREGRTLEAAPGGVYDITAAPGLHVPPPDGRWTAFTPPPPPADEPDTRPPLVENLELPPHPEDAGEQETTTEPAEGAASPESEG